MSEQTIKCPICNRPYVFYAYMAGDQSACPACRDEARKPERPKNHYIDELTGKDTRR